MSEELGKKIQDMFQTIYEAADKKHMRQLKRDMFKCGHDCLDDKNSARQAERCIEDCGRPMHKAMNNVQNEINVFQGRIDRCLMDCQDSARSIKQEAEAKHVFEACAEKCVKKFIPLVPDVIKQINEAVTKN